MPGVLEPVRTSPDRRRLQAPPMEPGYARAHGPHPAHLAKRRSKEQVYPQEAPDPAAKPSRWRFLTYLGFRRYTREWKARSRLPLVSFARAPGPRMEPLLIAQDLHHTSAFQIP